MIARFLANYDTWYPAGYRLFYGIKYGEGGWETVSGVDVARDPDLFVTNTDLEIITNPGLYPGYSHASALYPLDLATEVQFNASVVGAPGANFTTVLARLEKAEENNAPNYRFAEWGVFDNASAVALVQAATGRVDDTMILYGTFDPTTKDVTRGLEARAHIPAST